MAISTIIALVCMGAGTLFLIVGAVSIFRFPDFYTRLHGAGVGDTLGTLLLTIGMIILTGAKLLSIKVLIVFLVLLLTNPLGTNLIMITTVRANNYQGYNNKKPVDVEKEGGNDANITD